MNKIRAAIKGIAGYVPEYILDNDELSRMVDTSDEWITQRVGIKERRILKDKDKATSYMAIRAVRSLLEKTNTDPQDIDLLVVPTITSDMRFPSVSNLVCDNLGITTALNFDLSAACSGFIYGLETVSRMIET